VRSGLGGGGPPGAAALGGLGDVRHHAAEDHAVERGDRPPVRDTGCAPGLEDGPLFTARPASLPTLGSTSPRRDSCISARSRSRDPGVRASTRQKSSASPTSRRFGSRRPRRTPTPPASRSISPRTAQASGKEYQPVSPPMPSMTRHSASGEAWTTALRSSTNSEPPAQAGSLGSGSLGAPGGAREDHRVDRPLGVCRGARGEGLADGRQAVWRVGTYCAIRARRPPRCAAISPGTRASPASG
jgi:hypothetical protein